MISSGASNGSSADGGRAALGAARRCVIKLGTRVLTDDHGRLARPVVARIVDAAAGLRETGREVMIVSSGAVGLGQRTLGLDRACPHRGTRQACAAVGQAELMSVYQGELARHTLSCGQILVSTKDFETRERALHLRHVVTTLLRRGVEPILNENDALGAPAGADDDDEPVFTDNDRLAAIIASEISADLLILLTDVDGVFEDDPRRDAGAKVLPRIDDDTPLPVLTSRGGTTAGRGGMGSKVAAARLASRSGCHTVIASGRDADVLTRLTQGEKLGSWFPARTGLGARQRWIGVTGPSRGALRLDAGAVVAIRDRSASLLPAGVHHVTGAFGVGDVLDLADDAGAIVGRALSRLDHQATRHACGLRVRSPRPLIRRENIVMTTEPRHDH